VATGKGGGYDKEGYVYSITRPLTGSVSFPVKSFPDADALAQFLNEYTFFRYGGCCPTWRTVLIKSDCFSDEEKYSSTLKGENYTQENGKAYVIQLIGSGELVVHRTGSWLQPKDRNHHLPWPKSGTKKEEFLPAEQWSKTYLLGPHDGPRRDEDTIEEEEEEGVDPNKSPKNLSINSLDDISDVAINPSLVRGSLAPFVRGGNTNNLSLATGSVEINGKTQYLLSVSGKGWKSNAPDVVKINGVDYKVIRTDSGAVSSVTNGPNGSTNFNHAEQKLMSYVQENYPNIKANVSVGVQNTSISKPGMCSGCSITSRSFAENNPLYNVKFFEGTSRINP